MEFLGFGRRESSLGFEPLWEGRRGSLFFFFFCGTGPDDDAAVAVFVVLFGRNSLRRCGHRYVPACLPACDRACVRARVASENKREKASECHACIEDSELFTT